jgi:hypothetical protein
MAEIVEIGKGEKDTAAFLEPYIQSGSLSFLIGSGASFIVWKPLKRSSRKAVNLGSS